MKTHRSATISDKDARSKIDQIPDKSKTPEETQNAATIKSIKNGSFVMSQNTNLLKRSNSQSQFHSSMKIMDEQSNFLNRTKKQLARAEMFDP